MQKIPSSGLMILKDCLSCSAERLWASLLLDAIERAKGLVHVYLLISSKNILEKRYPRLRQYLSMNEIDSFAYIIRLLPELTKNPNGTTAVFLDSVDSAFLAYSFDRVIAVLKEISKNMTVIARVHDECISAQNWERLNSVAETTCSLRLDGTKTLVCTTISYKKNGKRAVKIEKIHIDDSLHITTKPYKGRSTDIPVKESSNILMPESSFDMGLNLKKSEREAKQHVPLPFEAAQKEEELVGLFAKGKRKVRVGGRIIYTPDEADDFDDSDPDDDLVI